MSKRLIKQSISRIKNFQKVIDGNECLVAHYNEFLKHERAELSDSVLKGYHFEFLITGSIPKNLNVQQIEIVEGGKLKRDGNLYKDWQGIPEKSQNFKDFCKSKNINFVHGSTHEFIEGNVRHKIITDIEATINNKPLIIDLKFSSSLTKRVEKEFSWAVNEYVDEMNMLSRGNKVWQALYYCSIMLFLTGKKYDFMFFVQNSTPESFLYMPYYLTFTNIELIEFWNKVTDIIKLENDTLQDLDLQSFTGEFENCINCKHINYCTNSNLISPINFIEL